MAEHLTVDQDVAGSSPVGHPKSPSWAANPRWASCYLAKSCMTQDRPWVMTGIGKPVALLASTLLACLTLLALSACDASFSGGAPTATPQLPGPYSSLRPSPVI